MSKSIGIKFTIEERGYGVVIEVASLSPMSLPEYLEVLEVWLDVTKKQHAETIRQYEELKNSGKIVSLSKWKNHATKT